MFGKAHAQLYQHDGAALPPVLVCGHRPPSLSLHVGLPPLLSVCTIVRRWPHEDEPQHSSVHFCPLAQTILEPWHEDLPWHLIVHASLAIHVDSLDWHALIRVQSITPADAMGTMTKTARYSMAVMLRIVIVGGCHMYDFLLPAALAELFVPVML